MNNLDINMDIISFIHKCEDTRQICFLHNNQHRMKGVIFIGNI